MMRVFPPWEERRYERVREYEGDDVGVGAGLVSDERVIVSVSIYEQA